jgi:hypothetical protein
VLATAAWALVGALAFAAGFAAAESPIRWLYRTNGFFAAAPLLAVGLVRRRENGPESASGRALRCLLALVLAYTVLYVALTPLRNTTGIHWGNRYLLELYPLLAVPCAAALLALRERPRARLGMALLALLAAASVALQLLSLDLLRRKLVFGEKLEHAVRAYPGLPIVTDVWWVPQTLAREFHRRPLYFVSAADDLRSLLERLARHGETGFLFVTTDVARAPDAGARSIDDEGLGFFSLRLSPHPLVGRTRQRVSFEPGRPSQRGVDAR